MSSANARNALSQYSQNDVKADIQSASPHRLIQMLLSGALDKIAAAKGHMQRGEILLKGRQVGGAISILEGLKMSLDKEKGGEIAANLEDLYIYMERRLIEANRCDDTAALDEVSHLLREVKDAWDAIAGQEAGLEKSVASVSEVG
jgi:flagellar protein FliS